MIRSLEAMQKITLRAQDGEIGRVEDVLFDEDRLRVRYLVAGLDELFVGRRVLLPAAGIAGPHPDTGALTLPITIEQVANSPEYSAGAPFLRQQEAVLHDYYGWPYYWGVGTSPEVGAGPSLPAYPLVELATEIERKEAQAAGGAPGHGLRSFGQVRGRPIQARDGEIGRLDDLLIDDESWRILYMVVDAGGWLTDRKVLVSPTWIERLDWEAGDVVVDLKRETIQNSPPYDPSVMLDEGYTTRLFEHYGRSRE